MKKQFVLIVCAILCAFAASCQDDLLYSCNPEIDKWAKENLADIQKMTRSDYLKFDISYQTAAYAAFTQEQKQSLWEGKVRELLTYDDWTESERNHIEKLLVYAQENKWAYDDNLSEENEAVADMTAYRWREYAKETLNWNDDMINVITRSPHKVVKGVKDGVETFSLALTYPKDMGNKKTRSDERPDCNCLGQTCGPGYYCLAGCKVVIKGCGAIWKKEDCTGHCVQPHE